MSKYKFKFKLGKIEGLEIEIEGDRQDIQTAQRLLDRLTSGTQPSDLLQVSAELPEKASAAPTLDGNVLNAAPPTRLRRNARKTSSSRSTEQADPLPDWIHDPALYGFPSDKWNTAQKGLWLLRVLGLAGKGDSFTSVDLTTIFNKHYKEAGIVRTFNMTRDLGKEKATKRIGVNNDKFFLTTQGQTDADALIQEALK